ncbi:unnamed protein product [Macrosiphum euphorbiae]|uniref:Uncharacterized protein n=1 Tax=Macrosiphum euphorbiae TaxID=13131 RepID=A0AAV0VS16_9HEMI|nr:unnamed protein product [Macrosiphum euphorbiae]
MNAAMTSEYAFKVVPIITKDEITVIEFLLQYFIRDEPLNASVELIKEKDIAKNFKNYIIGLFDNGE